MVWGNMAERSLIQLNTNKKVLFRSGVTRLPARHYTVFLHFHGSQALLKNIIVQKYFLAEINVEAA